MDTSEEKALPSIPLIHIIMRTSSELEAQHLKSQLFSSNWQRASMRHMLRRQDIREWIFAFVAVGALLLLQSDWHASLIWRDNGGSAVDMASAVANGDLIRRVLGVLLGVAGLLFLRVSRKVPQKWTQVSWIFVAWIVWLGLTAICSSDFSLSSKRYVLLLMAVISSAAFSRLPLNKILACIAGGAVMNLFIGVIAEFACGTFHPFQADYRLAGLTHPNLQGATLSIGFFASIGLFVIRPRRKRLALAPGILCLSSCLLTGSRTSIVALLIALFAGGILQLTRLAFLKGSLTNVLGMLVCAVVLATAMLGSFQGIRSTLIGSFSAARDDGGPEQLTGRVDLWKTCMEYASGHMLLGYGYDAFWTSRNISDISSEHGWAINEAHSGYIDEMLESGVPAASMFIALLLGTIALNVRAFSLGNGLCCVWVMLAVFTVVHSLSESIMLPVTFPSFFVLVALWRTAFGYDDPKTGSSSQPSARSGKGRVYA